MIKEKYIEAFLGGASFCMGIVFLTALGILYIYFVSQWHNKDIVQTLCSQKPYDFCEVVKQETTYKLKEFNRND